MQTLLAILIAAVPLKWTVETTKVQPAQFEVVHGESIALEAALQSGGKPLDLTGQTAHLYWQTNGMGSAWWTASATVNSNRLSAVFLPEMDPGASAVTGFIGVPGEIYRAAFQLRFRHGPGAVPNEIELPPRVIDFARVTVTNEPWATPSMVAGKVSKAGDTMTGNLVGINGATVDFNLIKARQSINLGGINLSNLVGSENASVQFRPIDGIVAMLEDLSADNATFSNAVVNVGIGIKQDEVARIKEMVSTFSDFPIGTGATTVGGLLLALAGAVTWLKRNKADTSTMNSKFSSVNTALAQKLGASSSITLPSEDWERVCEYINANDRSQTVGNVFCNLVIATAKLSRSTPTPTGLFTLDADGNLVTDSSNVSPDGTVTVEGDLNPDGTYTVEI